MPLTAPVDDGCGEQVLWEERGNLEHNNLDWEAKQICVIPYRDQKLIHTQDKPLSSKASNLVSSVLARTAPAYLGDLCNVCAMP